MIQKGFKDLSNYEKLLKTAETLRYSQGYYSRLYNQLEHFSVDEKIAVNNMNVFKDCKDTLDVVMILEG